MSVPPDLRPDGQEPRPASERELRQQQLIEDIARKERRKLRHPRHGGGIWFGLGTFGIVGWSIALPTLIGIAVALWANSIRPGTWTLGFFFLGLAIGLFNAWQWVAKEQRAMEREREERDRDE